MTSTLSRCGLQATAQLRRRRASRRFRWCTANPADRFSAYRIETEGRIIAYTADTEWTEALIPLGRNADLLIAEAYTFDRPVKNHLSLKALEARLADIKPKRLILTHMSDDMLGRLMVSLRNRKRWPG